MIKGKYLFLLVILLSLIGSDARASRVEPIYNVVNHPIPTLAQKLPLTEISKSIMIAGVLRHWRIDPDGPGRMRGVYSHGKHEATIAITFSRQAFSITLVSSVDLLQNGNEIHRNYNRWIRNLEQDIDNQLTIAGASAK